MKNVIIALFIIFLLFPFSNNVGKVVDKFGLYADEAMVAFQVADTDLKEVKKPDSIQPSQLCKCQGTKKQKSGDGIIDIPCVCMPNCKCKKIGEQMKDSVYYTYEFGAKWCGPCLKWHRDEEPKLKKGGWVFKNKSWKTGVNVVVVDVDEDAELFSKFATTETTSPVSIPYYVVVNNGVKVESHMGYMTWIEFANWHNDVINRDKSK